ncbi:phosphatase PAP2 family protein [Actinomadura madurae]|uniref:bifunctional phosphatase PAP2/O-acyltransferase family protein n=1 Tax=Actinomadura madurae TaxID=1993 RepID=UPI000DA0D9AF|nr:phosphatase PAP2 family protein [Actinomadura madurae]SPT63191.1 Probable diacyglycerol O-acyltransferase tgs1 [Actinomadura madurae]
MGTHEAVTAPDAVLAPDAAGTVPRARPRVRNELALGLALFALYSLVTMLPEQAREKAARDHGESLYALERALHLDVEPALNHWLADQPVWRVLANYEYAITYIASALALLTWLFLRHPERYRTARNAFVMLNLGGLACFALYPVMPPRLMPDLGFIDTVTEGRTWGSWGSPMVEHADRFAAVPSLHMAWTLWVGVELARVNAKRWVQGLNALHIIVTLYVILATANHYLLDAVAAIPFVVVPVYLAERIARPPAPRVQGPDAFFLAVETPEAPQQAGGVIMLDTPRADVGRADLVRVIRSRLDGLPRFRQRLVRRGRWRRPVWRDHDPVDWAWHVAERRVDGMAGLRAEVARIQAEPLPPDRPPWRMVVLKGAEPGRTAVVYLMHHVVADGVGIVAQAMYLMEPPPEPVPGPPRAPFRKAVATVVGLGQLATAVTRPERLPSAGTSERRYGTMALPLRAVRDVGRRHGARVTDVVLCAVAGALNRVVSEDDGRPGSCRVAVPLMMRPPGSAMVGNHTTAVMVDLPIGKMAETDRLAVIAERGRVLRSGTRAQAAWFVMWQAGRLMPAPLHARFARMSYSGRFLQGTVSSLPGPDRQLWLAGAPLTAVYPIVPLAPGTPLAIAGLGVDRDLCFGLSVDPGLTDDADALMDAVRDVIDELRDA